MAREVRPPVADIDEADAGAWHISVAPYRETAGAAPSPCAGLVEVQVASGGVAAAILLAPARARQLADDLRRMADAVEAARDAA